MNTQTSLFNNGPIILDATCSFKKIWPKIATIRIDIRPETNPDIVMDAKNLQFPSNYFDQIYCDPPHFIRKGEPSARLKMYRRLSGRKSPHAFIRYGTWNSQKEWFEFCDKTNNEFYRCLKKTGLLYYKITEAGGCTKPSDLIIMMTNFEVLEDKIVPSKSSLGKGITHWITFKPKESLFR